MLALKNLFRRKTRSVLTVVGVAIGIAAVVALVSVARGIRTQFNDFFSAGDAHLVLTRKGAADPFISYLPDTLLEDLRGARGVAGVHPFLFYAQQIPATPFFFFYGTTEGSPFLSQLRTVEGRDVFDSAGGPARRIAIGRKAAEALRRGIGSTLRLGAEEFTVVGIFETSLPLLDSGGLLPFEDAQRVAGLEGKMSSALVRLDSMSRDAVSESERALEEAFPDVEATSPMAFSSAFEEFALIDQAVVFLSLLAVLIGGIGVMNTMLMSVFERTREIGTLQAGGWSKGMILRLVIAEGLVVSLVGGVLGAGLGVLTVEAVGSIRALSFVSGEYRLALFVQALAVAVGMGLVGVAYPVLRAVRITPIAALRYE
jgi:putative ABC transport system permease protein